MYQVYYYAGYVERTTKKKGLEREQTVIRVVCDDMGIATGMAAAHLRRCYPRARGWNGHKVVTTVSDNAADLRHLAGMVDALNAQNVPDTTGIIVYF